MRTRVIPLAFALTFSVSLPLSAQTTRRTPSQTKPPGGIKWSQEKPAESGLDPAALESLYSDLVREPHHDLKGIVTIKDLLNMRSGLDANDEDPSTPGDEDNLDKSSDWIHTI
jgi:hypothetical protein